MHITTRSLAFVFFLMCSGCSKAETSDARKNHILAGDHGWIDLTINVPSQNEGLKSTAPCILSFSTNGEVLINESADLVQADASQNPIGYRFAVPSGLIHSELVLSSCIKNQQVAKLPFTLIKDHLAVLRFDGKSLKLQDSVAYNPTTLEGVHGEMKKIQESAQSSVGNITTLTKLVIASLLFNLIIMLTFIFRRRRN